MSTKTNTDVDPKSLEAARATWCAFTMLTQRGCIAVATILILMLIFLY